ncbi:MAG TPA: methylated-DNA--[protein]-cysteine S-methyltransferase [Caulobacteraceae bacterium]|nr:methylated-DNA--[protein]-cysteine S-methyltransferase [Caulobacteraceae bacterium]
MTAPQPERLILDALETPIGPILIATDEEGRLRAVDFFADEDGLRRLLARQYGPVAADTGQAPAPVRRAFEDYFAGDIRALERVPVATVGTAFQRKVWVALQAIPAGETRSYGQLAREIGAPKAMRAVGLANGQNPVALAIPCHRVIGADGSLTGFGGGLPRKRWLLRHEGAAFKDREPAPELPLAGAAAA